MAVFPSAIRLHLRFGLRTDPQLVSMLAELKPADRVRRVRRWIEKGWRLDTGQTLSDEALPARVPASTPPLAISSSSEPTLVQGASLEDGIAAFLGQRIR